MNKNLKPHTLSVKSFRGINDEISLQLGNITILKGENGTGKSSFVNAIEYLFSKDLAFLKNKTIKTKESAVHKNADIKDVKIELKFKKNRYIRFEKGKRENSPMFEDFLKNTYVGNASFILNRKKLLQFIDGTQGDRYKAVMDLCGMDKIDKIQSALSSSYSTLKKDLQNVKKDHDIKISELSNLLTGKSCSNFDECLNLLNDRLKENGKDTIDKNTNIEEFVENLDLSDFAVISNKIDSFNQVYDEIDLKFKLNDVLDEYESIASNNLKSSQALLKSLSTSKNYIEITNSDKCPVCENTIDSGEILSQISNKIEDINKNNSNFNDWKKKTNFLISKLNTQINYCGNLNEIIQELNGLIGNILPTFEYSILINLKDDLLGFLEFNKVASDFKDVDINPLKDEIISIKKLLIDFELSQDIDDLSNIYNMLFKIMELEELQVKINVLTKRRDVALKTLNVFTQSKEKFIGDIISEIQHDVKVYYEFIHGDDLISAPDIKLSGSKLIDVYLNSFGDVVDSRSYASEGHLDTLGICIFLAFNKKFNPLPLIVFDDVLTTVDLPHKERVGRLIVDKLVDYQFIITTHSSLWSEQLKRLCIDSKRNHVLYELIDWSLEEGPVTSKPLEAEQKIEKYLSPNHQDFQAAGNTARRYLEYTLTQICITNRIKVPMSDRYDVGTLFDEVKKFTERAVQGTSLEAYYAHVWSEINKTRYLANILSHHNEDSAQLPKSDVVKFCEDVINLNHAYKCDCGKTILKLDTKSNKLICSNENCRDAIDMNSFKDIDFGWTNEEIEL